MTLNDSKSLARHTSSISTLTTNSSLKIQLMKCKRDLHTQKERRHAAFAVEKDDVVDLVSKAHIATTKKLLLNKVGSMELQLVASSTRKRNWQVLNIQTEANNNQQFFSLSFPHPDKKLCQEGITGTLVDQVVQYRNHENARNGIYLDKLAHQRNETALRAIARNKPYTAGLHVAAGRYLVVPEVVDDQLKRKSHAEEVQSERENKENIYRPHMALANKVYAIRTLKNSLQSGQRRKRKQWQHGTSEQAIIHYQQRSNFYFPDTIMTPWCMATLQYQLQPLHVA